MGEDTCGGHGHVESLHLRKSQHNRADHRESDSGDQSSRVQRGYKRTITESISGSLAASQRPGFTKLLDRIEDGDVLVVTKLDRLGRNAKDARTTVEKLASAGVRVHCLQLGGADLTSAAGKLTMQVLCAVAGFERDLLIERTNSGIQRVKAQGIRMGRKHSLTDTQRAEVERRLAAGESVRSIASEFKTSRQSIVRVRNSESGHR